MELSFRIITSPGDYDKDILAFFRANDNEFYPPIAARKELSLFVQSVYNDCGQYVLCCHGDRIVGLTTVIANHPNFLHYYQYVAIDKAYRKRGIADKLYKMVTQILEDAGVLRAIVKTWSLNKASQAMFRKHGFFHGETIEDDRSRGVHSYFYFKSFSQHWFREPLGRLAVVGNGVTAVNFAKMLFAITKDTPGGKGPLPFVIVNEPALAGAPGTEQAAATISRHLPPNVSHLMFLNLAAYKNLRQELFGNIEIPPKLTYTRDIIRKEGGRWLLAGEGIDDLLAVYDLPGIVAPGEKLQIRLREIVSEIAAGYIAPAYYKVELAGMAVESGCTGVLLGSPELHSMFGFDRQFNSVRIYDPLLELIFIIQNNRVNGNG